MDLTKSALVFFTSLMAGFMGGQVGGGGLLNLPILMLVGLNPLVAIGTNKFAAVFIVLISAKTFYQKHKLPLKKFSILAAASLVGSIVGVFTLFSFPLDEMLLKKITVGILLLVSFIIFYKQNLGLHDQELTLSRKNFGLLIFFVFLISVYGGMFTIAMTTLFAMVFTLNKQSFAKSMSFALALTFVVIFSSTLFFIYYDLVNYHFAAVQAVGGTIGAGFGSKLAVKKGNLWIKNFSLVIVLVLLLKLLLEIY